MSLLWRKVILALSIALNCVLFYSLVWGEQGAIAYKELKERCTALEISIGDLDRASGVLSKEIALLQKNSTYQEKIIRTRLNFVKRNEILYVFPQMKTDPVGALQDEGKN